MKKLFGTFDHNIQFNTKEHIKIIHGSNGLGKTAILRMINGFFNSRYSEFRSIPFLSFSITFNDDAKFVISKQIENGENEGKYETGLRIEYSEPGQLPREGLLGTPIRPEEVGFPLRYLEESIPGLSRVAPNAWRLGISGEVLSFEELIENYGEFFPTHFAREHQITLFEGANRGEST